MGIVDGEIVMQELFTFRQLAVTPDGRAVGYHTATGVRSNFLAHFQSNGVELPAAMFEPATQPAMELLY
jgi:pilus assembly protein CpaF